MSNRTILAEREIILYHALSNIHVHGLFLSDVKTFTREGQQRFKKKKLCIISVHSMHAAVHIFSPFTLNKIGERCLISL